MFNTQNDNKSLVTIVIGLHRMLLCFTANAILYIYFLVSNFKTEKCNIDKTVTKFIRHPHCVPVARLIRRDWNTLYINIIYIFSNVQKFFIISLN